MRSTSLLVLSLCLVCLGVAYASERPNFFEALLGAIVNRLTPPKEVGIARGQRARQGEYPFLGMLFYETNGTFSQECSVQILSSKYLLCACHCTWGIADRRIFVKVGTNDRDDPASPLLPISFSKCIDGHHTKPNRNDVSVIELQKPLELGEKVAIVRIPTSETASKLPMNGEFAGWGGAAPGSPGNRFLQTLRNIDVYKHEDCLRYWSDLPANMFCALAKNATACSGDSGGGFFVKDGEGQVFSLGTDSYTTKYCLLSVPFVFMTNSDEKVCAFIKQFTDVTCT